MKAFTLFEAVVVMILFAITFVLCSYFMETVWYMFNLNKSALEKNIEVNLFYDDISQKFKKSQIIYWDPYENELKCVSKDDQTTYSFKKKYILRSNGQKQDTFKIANGNPIGMLNGSNASIKSAIDVLAFSFIINNDSANVELRKEYDSVTKLKIEEKKYGFN